MPVRVNVREQAALLIFWLKWLLLAIPVGTLVGSACALFLWSLERATHVRFEHPWLLFLLPVAGLAIGLMYAAVGKSVEAGNNLIVDEIHEPGGGIPFRMAPLVLIGTVVTHLCGGSAGREGTAVQMGGSIASGLAQWLPFLSRSDVRTLLTTGIAAGFGGVFGTPVAGTIFALEVLTMGRMSYAAILPCLMAAVMSDWSCSAWSVGHTHYHVASLLPPGSPLHLVPVNGLLLGKIILAGICFGWTSVLFAETAHGLHALWQRLIPRPILRPVAGGLMVIALVWLLGTRDYLGLGVTSPDPQAVTIVSSFQSGGAHAWSWFWKLIFTAITLSCGFKGGEVTPLFFIGAALGNTLAGALGGPTDLFAAAGFLAVFAGATNTPIACTLMGIELFGGECSLYFASACLVAYLFSGHSGIYLSQRIGTPKTGVLQDDSPMSLRTARAAKSAFLEELFGAPEEALNGNGESLMPHRHRVVSQEIGQLRIYLRQGERRPGQGLRSLFRRSLYHELIDLAKTEGIPNATTHITHYGYSNHGKAQSEGVETPPEPQRLRGADRSSRSPGGILPQTRGHPAWKGDYLQAPGALGTPRPSARCQRGHRGRVPPGFPGHLDARPAGGRGIGLTPRRAFEPACRGLGAVPRQSCGTMRNGDLPVCAGVAGGRRN
jgi:H+/Cl- antiporter ClcA